MGSRRASTADEAPASGGNTAFVVTTTTKLTIPSIAGRGCAPPLWAATVAANPPRRPPPPVGGALAGLFSLTGGTKQAGGSAGWGRSTGRRCVWVSARTGGGGLDGRPGPRPSRAERRRLRRSHAARPSWAVGGLGAAAAVSAEAAARAGSVPSGGGGRAGRGSAPPRGGPGSGPLAVHPDDSDHGPGAGRLSSTPTGHGATYRQVSRWRSMSGESGLQLKSARGLLTTAPVARVRRGSTCRSPWTSRLAPQTAIWRCSAVLG